MSRRGFYLTVIPSAVLWTVALLVASASGASGQQRTSGAREDISEYLPPGNGKALVAKECAACHDFRNVVRFRASKQAWEAVVLDMVARGAPLMIEDADAITSYLSEVFGPKAPPLVDVNTATRDELVKLPGMTPELADRVAAHRKDKGPFSSRDEVRAVIGFDAPAFDKVKWYIRAAR